MTHAPETAPSDERPLSRVYAALFLVLICLPSLRMVGAARGQGAAREQRRSERSPALTASAASWSSFPRRFDDWYASEFGFRDALVHQHSLVKWFGLASSPSASVVQGRDSWLFYTENRALDMVRGALPFEQGEVDDWVALLEERRAWLAERGIRYLFVVAPVKPSIYPDFQPPGYGRVGPSRLDQLADAMAARGDDSFLDLRAALIDERSNDRGGDWSYYPLGTHWTRRGALRAWREIVNKVPDLLHVAPPPLEELPRLLLPEAQGDSWGERLYLEDVLRQEEWVLRLTPGPQQQELEYERRGARFEAEDPTGLPRVVLYHDSFGSHLRPLLARSCASLSCAWRYAWDLARIEEEQPDLVIDLVVERALAILEPAGMALDTQERLRANFEQAGLRVAALGAQELAELDWRPTRTDPQYHTVTLPGVDGASGGEGWIALDIESATGGVLELRPKPESLRGMPSLLRQKATRVFAQPGRWTLYVPWKFPSRPGDVLLSSKHGDWALHAVESRRAKVPR